MFETGVFWPAFGSKVRQEPLAVSETLGLGPLRQVRLDCAIANPLSESVNLTAYVNSTQVLTAHEEQGANEYQAMVLVLGATGTGVEIQFDNAKAVVPE